MGEWVSEHVIILFTRVYYLPMNAQVIVLKSPMNHNWPFYQSVTLASMGNALPEDGVTAPKHVGAILV